MIWKYIHTGFNNGKFNMDYDLKLALENEPEQAVLRLYRWHPYCISLGANQSSESLNLRKVEEDNLEVVNRPTGGRAVLHAEELTYSVIYPVTRELSVHEIYRRINKALAAGLGIYDPALADVDLENVQTDFPAHYKNDIDASLCFAVPAKSELKLGGRKLAGSAQRKFNNVILQHGSILTGTFHRRLVNYLNLPAEEIENIKKELIQKTIELETVLNKEVDFGRLSDSIRRGFEVYFETELTDAAEPAEVN